MENAPLQEFLGLAGVGQDGTLNHPQTSFTTFQSAELDLSRDADSSASLNPGDGDADVLLIGLAVSIGSITLTSRTHIRVRSINHDGVKLDALLRKTDGKLELLLVGGVVEVD